jgi:cell division protein ZipA
MRDWLTFGIVALIIIILVDGVRRMRLVRRDKIRMSRNIYKQSSSKEGDVKIDAYTSELPNGGARVVGHREATPGAKQPIKTSQRRPEQASLNLDEAVPMLMESVADDESIPKRKIPSATTLVNSAASAIASAKLNPRNYVDDERIEPTFSNENNSEPEGYESNDNNDSFSENDEPENYSEDDSDDQFDHEADYENDYDYEDESDNEDYDDELDDDLSKPEHEPIVVATDRPDTSPEEVLIINVMAGKSGNFNGEDLLNILLDCGLRFGDMDIFHRYSDSKGEGALLFSMANMVKPGTFDLDAMDQFETPGVSFFMTLPLKADSMQSFELMADTARTIAEQLDGELKDEQRSVMTRQTIEHCRERIRDFERRRLFASRQR